MSFKEGTATPLAGKSGQYIQICSLITALLKQGHMLVKIPRYEKRTYEELKEHYEIEKELAEGLRNSTKEQRRKLYSSVYDELFERIHPYRDDNFSCNKIERGEPGRYPKNILLVI